MKQEEKEKERGEVLSLESSCPLCQFTERPSFEEDFQLSFHWMAAPHLPFSEIFFFPRLLNEGVGSCSFDSFCW